MLLVEHYRAMDDTVRKKRDRVDDDCDQPEAIQPNKKLLLDIFTSLNLSEGGSNDFEPGTITECTCSDVNDMETDALRPGSVLKPSAETEMSTEVCLRNENDDNFYSILKNGTRKYGRRVDYLVDELIRKSQKTYTSGGCSSDLDLEAIIPSSIGPHPLTDRLLGKLWPTVVPTEEGATMLTLIEHPRYPRQGESRRTYTSTYNTHNTTPADSEQNSDMEEETDMNEVDQNSVEMNEMVEECAKVDISASANAERAENICISESSNNIHHAGLITHSDWGIEDVT